MYIAIAATVWIAIITATATMLNGTPYLVQVLPILFGGALIFVIMLPLAWRLPPTPPNRR